MKKSLAPLIIAFAVIILLTFIVINSKPGAPRIDYENPAEKSFLRLDSGRNPVQKQQTPSRLSRDSGNFSPDISALVENAQKFLAADDREGAEDSLRTVLVFDPLNKSALSLLGGIFYRSGRYKEAEELFSRLVSIEKENDAPSLNHLASTLAKQGKYNEAIALCQKAIQKQPDFAEAQINISAIYAAAGDVQNSTRHLLLAYKLMGYGILSYSVDPVFDKVRALPEFQEIVERARKDWERDRKTDK
jgi:tetratricopeptide (TPR) repeat protein